MADETDRTPGSGGSATESEPTGSGPVGAAEPVFGAGPTHPTAQASGPAAAVNLDRRRFFRHFASDLIQTAATVVGAANAIQRTSAEAASALLDPAGTAGRLGVEPVTGTGVPSAVFRTAFRLEDEALILVDQRKLPDQVAEYECQTAADVAHAIRERVVRGAPALGQVAALGLALAAHRMRAARAYARRATLRGSANALLNARPTSITIRAAVERMLARYESVGDLEEDGGVVADALRNEADAIVSEAIDAHGRLAEHGLAELPVPEDRPLRILTLGNSGVLAGGQYGTALGVVSAAAAAGRELQVYVCETRPLLEGARLTTWELQNAGIPCTLIADAAAAGLMAHGTIDLTLVAADRVAANGDVAAVLGTYALAVLAARHGVPFVVCAPLSTVDLATVDGAALPIEERPASELLWVRDRRIAPADTEAENPLADMTSGELISAIVTEEGVLRAPFGPPLGEAVEAARQRRASAAPDVDLVKDAERLVSVKPSAGAGGLAEAAPVAEGRS